MPSADELPGPLATLARRNALEISDARFNRDASALADAISGYRIGRWKWRLPAALAALLVLSVSGWLTLRLLHPTNPRDEPSQTSSSIDMKPQSEVPTSGPPVVTTPPVPPKSDTREKLRPTEPPAGLMLASISAGGQHTCGVSASRVGYCWGRNYDGELGDGSRNNKRMTPARILGEISWRTISIGEAHACGIAEDGGAYCWGKNNAGQLGDGTRESRRTPDRVVGELSWTALSVGRSGTCAIARDGGIYCWGAPFGFSGMTRPTRTASELKLHSISVGGEHVCGVTTSGTAHCWGRNLKGQLGDRSETDGNLHPLPQPVSGDLTFASVSAGDDHTCGVTRSGGTYCWGGNSFGQVGDGSTTNRSIPVRVVGGYTFTSVSAGRSFTCALNDKKIVYCWGLSTRRWAEGRAVSEDDDLTTPGRLVGEVPFVSISAGWNHACGLTSNGAAYCWGSDVDGQLGIGDQFPPPILGRVLE